LKDADSDTDSDEDDQQKVLKSGKDKRFDELEATIRQIENAQKINDWAVISERTSPPGRVPTADTRVWRRGTGIAGIANTRGQSSTRWSARCRC
jgi:hypothetical protein